MSVGPHEEIDSSRLTPYQSVPFSTLEKVSVILNGIFQYIYLL